jgi:signal peptidase II
MLYLMIPIGLFLTDFLVKKHIDENYKASRTKEICNGKITIKKVYNEGAMLNILEDKQEFVAGLSTGISVVLFLGYLRLLSNKGYKLLKLALGFVLGGAASNVYDRVVHKRVIDYFSFRTKNQYLRNIVFNLADIFIFIGAALFLIFEFIDKRKK